MNQNNYFSNNDQQIKQSQQHIAAVVPKYTPLLYTILFLLLIDFLINSFSEFGFNQPIAMLVMFM